MKKFFISMAVLLAVGTAYLLGSFSARKVIVPPPANWTGDSQAATAWRELVISMEAAGAEVFAATDNSRERLEGLALLSHLLSASLEMKLTKGNPADPRFTDWMGDSRKFLGDSPDAVYHTAPVSAQYSYEVTGNIADAEYLGFMLYGRGLNGWNRAAANLSRESIAIDQNGDFRILLSRTRPEGETVDWLALEDDVHTLMVRQYFHDRPASREATLRIRNLSPGEYHYPSDKEVADGLRHAATFFNDTLDGALALADMMSSRPNDPDPPKAYNPDFAGIFYPTFDNQYLGAWYKVEEDEALIIEGEVPDAPYWSVSLQNRWLQSLGYRHFRVSLNDRQIETEGGRYRIILSHRRPDAANWLDAAGHTEGLLAIRYQMAEAAMPPPTLTLVKFVELPERSR